MLIFSMNVSVDGFIADRDGDLGWGAPSEELFRFQLQQVGELGGYLLGRRLYEAMVVWETDPSLRDGEDRAAFADAWSALPKVVFSRTLESVEGNARLAAAPLAEEVAQTPRPAAPPPRRHRRRHALPAAGRRRAPAGPDRDPHVRLGRDLRALPARLNSKLHRRDRLSRSSHRTQRHQPRGRVSSWGEGGCLPGAGVRRRARTMRSPPAAAMSPSTMARLRP